jgi:hypothetical protein
MNASKATAPSDQLLEVTSSELSSVEGGNTIAILGVPFLIGCVIGDALWGDGSMSMEDWCNKYIK